MDNKRQKTAIKTPNVYLVNYANYRYKIQQWINTYTAKKTKIFKKIYSFSPGDLDKSFLKKNKHILKFKRGGGYWLWKPYFILRTLNQLNEGEILVYSDSGQYFIKSPIEYVKACIESEKGFLCFSSGFIEKKYTKRDLFIALDCDKPEFSDTDQTVATILLIKKNALNVKIIEAWLKIIQNAQLVTDSPSAFGKDDYPDFKEHRHDQSILSLLLKNHKLSYFPHFPIRFSEDNIERENKFGFFMARRGVAQWGIATFRFLLRLK